MTLGKKRKGWKLGLFSLAVMLVLTACQRTWKNQNIAEQNADNPLEVCFFACSEDADSILMKTGDTDIVIDTGIEEDSDKLVEKLQALEIDDIELLILTHPDKDHIGGAAKVLDAFEVEQVIQTSCIKGSELQEKLEEKLKENPGGEKVVIPKEIQEMNFGELQLMIYPPEKDEYDNSNNYSIGVMAEYQGKRFFFAGDAKKKRINELLKQKLPMVDVYKVAHHGRDNGSSDELIEQLRPEYAVVTAPRAEEKNERTLNEVGAKICSTYEKDVCFTVEGGILDVR